MTKRKRSERDPGPGRRPAVGGAQRRQYAGEASGPEAEGRWGSPDGFDRPAPWGVSEDSPMDEGSEPTAVPPGRRGERRAAEPARPGRYGLGSVEPTRVPAAGPGAPPDPAPARRPFPAGTPADDPPDNPLERQTGMPTRGTRRSE